MKVIFLWKGSKFYIYFKKAIKLAENLFTFKDTRFLTCCRNFSQLWQEYSWSAVNMSKSGPRISDPTKRHDTQLNFFNINGKSAKKCCLEDFSSVSDHLTPWLPNVVLKQDHCGIQVTTFFGLKIFENISAMKVIFCWKTVKYLCKFQKSNKISRKCFCVSR